MKYIYAPLDLTDEEFHIYILMYKKCFFKTMELKYTYNQIIIDSNPIFRLTERKVRTIISNFIKNGFLEIIFKGKKGSPTVYKIIKIEELMRHQCDTNATPMRQESDRNKLDTPKVVADERQESDRKATLIRQESVNPINDKDNDKDKEKDIKSVSSKEDVVEKKVKNNDSVKIKDVSYKEIVDCLNEKTGKKFRYDTTNTIKCINARWNDGYVLEDFKKVIDIKYSTWKGTEWEKYLRPETLFGTKFESYLNELPSNNKKKNEYDRENVEYGW